MHKDSRKIKARIRSAFIKLNNDNICAMPNFTCCDTCAGSEIIPLVKKYKLDGYAFYHMQDNETINDCGNTYISFGDTTEIAKRVVKALESCKLEVSWNGKLNTRIFVKGIKNT